METRPRSAPAVRADDLPSWCGDHRPELDDVKRPAIPPDALLRVEDGPSRGRFGRQRDEQEHRGEEGQNRQRYSDIERALPAVSVERHHDSMI